MKHEAPKTAIENRANRNWRAAFVEEVGQCQNPFCGGNSWPLHVHEIGRGRDRNECKKRRFGCLVLCDYCNSGEFTDAAIWPMERQLALKLIVDPEHFDLAAFNALRQPKCELLQRKTKGIEGNDVLPYLVELIPYFVGSAA